MNTMQPNDEKWLGLAASLAASVVPQVIGALRRRKDFAPEASAAAFAGAAMAMPPMPNRSGWPRSPVL